MTRKPGKRDSSIRRWPYALAVLLPLAACAPSAEGTWHRLTAIPGQPRAVPPWRIELRDIRLAGYLDRTSIVHALGDTQLVIEGGRRWAGPLDDMTTDVLVRDLEQRLPGCVVQRERGAITGEPQRIAGVEIDRFEIDATGLAVLSGKFTIRAPGNSPGDGPLRDGRVDLSVAPSGPGINAQVRALSEVLARLGDRLAAALSSERVTG